MVRSRVPRLEFARRQNLGEVLFPFRTLIFPGGFFGGPLGSSFDGAIG